MRRVQADDIGLAVARGGLGLTVLYVACQVVREFPIMCPVLLAAVAAGVFGALLRSYQQGRRFERELDDRSDDAAGDFIRNREFIREDHHEAGWEYRR